MKYQLNQENDLDAKVINLTKKVEAMEMRKLRNVKSIQNEEVFGIYDIDEPIPSPYSNPPPHHSSESKTLEETLQIFMHEQTIFNNQTSHAINEIKSTLSTLTSSLEIQENNEFSF